MKDKVKCWFCNKELLRYPTKTNAYFCDIKCKANWQTLQREKLGYTKEWLIDQYFNKGKTCNDIAKDIGRDSKRVWEWFKQYGIQVNKRGTNYEKNLLLDGSAFLGKKHKEETKEKIRQARIKDGHVPYLKNGVHWLKHEGAKSPMWKGGISPERQKVYSSLEWCEAVKGVWKRDNATCQKCGKHHNTTPYRGTFHIHHIESFMTKEKRTDINNLILLCKECHKWVHSKKNVDKLFIK